MSVATITATGQLGPSRSGPYESGGALYIVLAQSGAGALEVNKSSDGGATWTTVATIACQANYELNYGTDFYGGMIYIAHWENTSETNPGLSAAAHSQIAVFDCSTDAVAATYTGGPIGTVAEKTPTTPDATYTGGKPLFCAYQPATSSVVVVYQDSVRDHGTPQYFDANLSVYDIDHVLVGEVWVVAYSGGWGSPLKLFPAPGIGDVQSWTAIGATRGNGLVHVLAIQTGVNGAFWSTVGSGPLIQPGIVADGGLLDSGLQAIATDVERFSTPFGNLAAAHPVSVADGSIVYAAYNDTEDSAKLLCASSGEAPAWSTTTITTGINVQLGITAAGAYAAIETSKTTTDGGGNFGADLPANEATGCAAPARTLYAIDQPAGEAAHRGDGGIAYASAADLTTTFFLIISGGSDQNVTGVSGIITVEEFGRTHGVTGGGEPPGCGAGPPITPVPGTPPATPGTAASCGTIGYAF